MLKNNPYMKAYLNVISESSDIEKYQSIAKEIGGEYIPETNTIDCKGNKVKFKNTWLNNKGSFDFKLINTSDDWSGMFSHCSKLSHLPEDFIIPEGVTECYYMFADCELLTHLPKEFKIPNSVVDCNYMFIRCVSLWELPNNFILSNNIITCRGMFVDCKFLTNLPDNFTIPESVMDCSDMFAGCNGLKCLPDNFRIPNNSICNDIFYGCHNLENKDPKAYRMWEI